MAKKKDVVPVFVDNVEALEAEPFIIMERTFTRMGTICGHSEARWDLCFNIRSISYLK